MKFVVTGAAGFIGGNLVRGLLRRFPGSTVVGIDSFTDYYSPALKRANVETIKDENFQLIEGDLLEMELDVFDDATAIFHQAGQPGVRKSWGTDFAYYSRMNIDVTQRILEKARSISGLQRLVYASSSSVYGDAESFPTSEKSLPLPKSPYGVSKLAAEHLVSLYATNFNVPTVSLRYFTVYGPGQRPDMAFNRFITAALSGQAITVYGDGEQRREFTHVNDIVNANILAWESKAPNGAVINLSGGSSVTVNEVLAQITELHGDELEIDYQDDALGDVRRTSGTTELAKNLLGWEPSVNIQSGLKSQYEWMLSQYEKSSNFAV